MPEQALRLHGRSACSALTGCVGTAIITTVSARLVDTHTADGSPETGPGGAQLTLPPYSMSRLHDISTGPRCCIR